MCEALMRLNLRAVAAWASVALWAWAMETGEFLEIGGRGDRGWNRALSFSSVSPSDICALHGVQMFARAG